MDKAQFLKNLRESKVKLHALQIDGWEGLVYLRPQTMGEIRDALVRMAATPEGEDVKAQVNKDPLFLARSIGRLIRDEHGTLLFDADDDGEMAELMAVLADAGPAISKQVNQRYNALNEPLQKVEVTPEGNSPSARSS